MNRNNRYCCLVIPSKLSEKCNYFEMDLYVKSLKKIIEDINKEINCTFDYYSAIIDEDYGILIYENSNIENEYINNLCNLKRNGRCLLICHIANLDKFIKSSKSILETSNILEAVSNNSDLSKKMLLLCINFIITKNV